MNPLASQLAESAIHIAHRGSDSAPHVVVIGAGFTGLAAAYQLACMGIAVTVLEADADVGGLAGSFDVNGIRLEKFYHHWFVNDSHIMRLIADLGCDRNIIFRPTRTGMYFANNLFNLSSPLDLLRFKPLNYVDRIRLAAMVLRARAVTDWRQLESLTARDWAVRLGGDTVYKVVWEPLLRGKFGAHEPDISAVWFWNKLKLRGGKAETICGEREVLAYYRGGIAMLARRIADEIVAKGGRVLTGAPADSAPRRPQSRHRRDYRPWLPVNADAVIATPSLPIVADLIRPPTSRPPKPGRPAIRDPLPLQHLPSCSSSIAVCLISIGSTSTIPAFRSLA